VRCAALLGLALSCTGCATLAGAALGSAIDRSTFEHRVSADSLAVLRPGDHVLGTLQGGRRFDGRVLAVELGADSTLGLRIRPLPTSSTSLSVADDSTSLAPRVVPAAAIRTLVRRDPGRGSGWLLALAGLGVDIWVLTNLLEHHLFDNLKLD
jgi:hypothetical protein